MTYSPVLGAVTAAFEIFAAIWVLKSRVRKPLRNPIAVTLFLLATYQLLEVAICLGTQNEMGSRLLLSRLAFLLVTWLPSVNLLFLARLLPQRSKALFRFAYIVLALAAVMSFWILVDYRFVTGTICEFMYARYKFFVPYFHLYGLYYEISQMCMIFIPAYLLVRIDDVHTRRNLGDMLFGALLYILPSFFIAAVFPGLFQDSLPSILCHFALLYAVFLVRIARREDHATMCHPAGRKV